MTNETETIYRILQNVAKQLMDGGMDYYAVTEILWEAVNNNLGYKERQSIIDKWSEEREEIRQEAIDYQNECIENEDIDFQYQNEKVDYFTECACMYNLSEEFVENGIICAEDKV